VEYAVQTEQLGTGHAVMQAADILRGYQGPVLVVCGDTPLLTVNTLQKLINAYQANNAAAAILTAFVDNPYGYGRIIRDQNGQVRRIVEEKDANEAERKINEINTGTYCFNSQLLFAALEQITAANQQGEYYLTDVIEIFVKQGLPVVAEAGQTWEVMGINNRQQLAVAEKIMREQINAQWMLAGVTMLDPASTFIDASVTIGRDTIIYPWTLLEGKTVIGEDCVIGPQTRIKDSVIGEGTEVIQAFVVESQIGKHNTIGPYTYLRPGTNTGDAVKIGGFVEVKKSMIGDHSKVPHLSYVGDATIGKAVNIGAGTIFCNYDGKHKHPTIIADGSFIGSNTNLVAPVKIGENAITGAGSTITEDVPADTLAIARNRQTNLIGWVKKHKQE